MFVGHLAVGLAAKRIEPRVSIGTWMLAAMLADLLAFCLFIAGIEHAGIMPGVETNRFLGDIPYSHSLLMDLGWAVLFAIVYFVFRRDARAAWLLCAAVVSHWLLDFISHRPDMQLAPSLPAGFGLGLWNSIPATLIVEGGVWLIAVILYVRITRPKTRAGRYMFWAGVILFTLAWYGNITAGIQSDSVRAGISGLIFVGVMIAWAYWMNRVRPVAS